MRVAAIAKSECGMDAAGPFEGQQQRIEDIHAGAVGLPEDVAYHLLRPFAAGRRRGIGDDPDRFHRGVEQRQDFAGVLWPARVGTAKPGHEGRKRFAHGAGPTQTLCLSINSLCHMAN